MATDWLKAIEGVRKYVKTDPELVAPIVRDWPITAEARLTDLAWSMCRDGYITPNDARFLLDRLEEYVNGQN